MKKDVINYLIFSDMASIKSSADNNNDTRQCIQLKSQIKSPHKMYWTVSKTNNNGISQSNTDDDEENEKWSGEINSGCVYSKVNDRSQSGNLMNE